MARGFVKKRGGVWYAYWRDPAGAQKSKAVGPRKKEAEVYLTTVQSRLTDGTYRELAPITFPEFAEQWLRDYAAVQVKPSTLLNYKSMTYSSLIPFFGDVPLTSIRTADVQRYVAERVASGVKAATVQ